MTVPIRRRTRAREIAMQALFQFDLRGQTCSDELESPVEDVCRSELLACTVRGTDDDQDPEPVPEDRKLNGGEREILTFAVRLVEGTLANRPTIDERLQGVTRNWDLRRMAIVDRNVLRLAVYELMFCDDVPPKVAINEAIEMGKKFSTANSGGFVNGILDRIRIDLQSERTAGEAGA